MDRLAVVGDDGNRLESVGDFLSDTEVPRENGLRNEKVPEPRFNSPFVAAEKTENQHKQIFKPFPTPLQVVVSTTKKSPTRFRERFKRKRERV